MPKLTFESAAEARGSTDESFIEIKEYGMKTMSCDMCDKKFSAESFDEWFKQMQGHYMSDHADFMEQAKNKPKEEGMKWMAEMKAKFEAL